MKHRIQKRFSVAMLTVCSCLICCGLIHSVNHLPAASAKQVYDISQWQGRLSNQSVRDLKHEVPFVILRAQDGGLYDDTQFAHNAALMRRNRLPYGAYSYSLASDPAQAHDEAYALVKRAPAAKFYVNDLESENNNSQLAASARSWAQEIHHLTNRPAILYSYTSFINEHLRPAISAYNGVWLAQYSTYEPDESYHYDLWQFTDNHYSRALNQRLDDSTFPTHARPLSFWIGGKDGRYQLDHTRRQARSANNSANYYYRNRLNRYINHNYYSSPRIKHFKTRRRIMIYDASTGQQYYKISRGQVLNCQAYQLYYHKRQGLTTRAIGIWNHHTVLYTTNRKYVKPVR